MHTLPEWRDPNGSSIPMDLADVLAACGVDEGDVEEIESALLRDEAMDALRRWSA